MKITERQDRILTFVREFWTENGFGPSIAEIGTGVGLNSKGSTAYQLGLMESAGLIERNPLLARTIRLSRVAAELSDERSETGRIDGSPAEDATPGGADPDPASPGMEPPMTITATPDNSGVSATT